MVYSYHNIRTITTRILIDTGNRSIGGKSIYRWNQIRSIYKKSLHLLGKNQYTFNVESGFTKTEIKHWVKLFFGVKAVAVNSHQLRGKGRRIGPILDHTMHYRHMIITLQPGYLLHF
ncbi:hypothetical protein ZWY2020_005190 [Hordeum vulgare]|nr:hypothetical protein ZWY2020_005190 [Hordeum vulgare]